MATDKELVRSKIRARSSAVDAFVSRLDKVLATKLERILVKLKDNDLQSASAANVLLNAIETLKSTELREEILSVAILYKTDLRELERYFKKYVAEGNPVFSSTDLQTIETLINLEIKRTTSTLSQNLDDVSSQVMSTILTGDELDISTIVDTASKRTTAQIKTELATTLSGFSSAVNMRKAQDLGLTLFEYAGPDDKVTRPFCNDLLAKHPPIYTIDEIDKMDNGQNLSVKTYGGGWNCRHEWMAISEKLAKSIGYEP